ncbi:MAG TPA: M48 family metallopeptidase [Steroidobacteraceae bacterium]|nr:M48 family metallopeptidase [Steroidobacteraceae bacterium]
MDTQAALISRMDRLAHSRPGLFRARAIGTLALGYAGAACLALAPFGAATLGLLALRHTRAPLAAAPAALVLVLLAIWVASRRSPAPGLPGESIDAIEADGLHAMLTRLRCRLRVAYPREVRVTAQFDAALFQDSNQGIFGRGAARSVLLLGLPLMKCLSEAQLEAVLAHELGHLVGVNAAATSRARHLQIALQRLQGDLFRENGRPWRILSRVLAWYLPRLEACTVVWARANETDADRVAAELTSPQLLAQALVAHAVVGEYWHRHYWRWVGQSTRELPPRLLCPYTSFNVAAFRAAPEELRRQWLETAIRLDPGPTASHRSLWARIEAAGSLPELALPVPGRTADRLLRAECARLDALFDRRWREGTVAARRLLHGLLHYPAGGAG